MYPGSVGAVKTKQTTNLIILSTLENFGVNWVCVFIQQLTQRSSTWRMLAAQLPHTGTLLYRQVDGILLWLPLLLLSLFYWCHVFSKHTEVPSCCFHIYLNLECMKSPDTVCVCACVRRSRSHSSIHSWQSSDSSRLCTVSAASFSSCFFKRQKPICESRQGEHLRTWRRRRGEKRRPLWRVCQGREEQERKEEARVEHTEVQSLMWHALPGTGFVTSCTW